MDRQLRDACIRTESGPGVFRCTCSTGFLIVLRSSFVSTVFTVAFPFVRIAGRGACPYRAPKMRRVAVGRVAGFPGASVSTHSTAAGARLVAVCMTPHVELAAERLFCRCM